MDRKTMVAYAALFAISTLVALVSLVLFGTASHPASIPGDVEALREPPSVWILLTTPALLVAAGSLFAFVLDWHIREWPQIDKLSPDARRGLDRYQSALRCFLIGVGVLATMVQAFVILGMAGVELPVDLDMRAFYFGFGLLVAGVGNVTPKIPPVPDSWYKGAEVAKLNRFVGWVFTLGGLSFCLSALLVPSENLKSVTQIIICAIIGLPVLQVLLQALVGSRKTA
jgi:hypothetical protein